MTTETMYNYQKATMARIKSGCQGFFTPYGTGKSWVILEFLSKLNIAWPSGLKPGLRIIFCNRRNMITWRLEIKKRRGEEPRIYEGRGGLLDLLAPGKRHIHCEGEAYLLFPHHLIATSEHNLNILVDWGGVLAMVGDETTKWKNPKTNVTKAILRLSQIAPTGIFRLVMAGRPMPEGPQEIWSQFEFLYPHKNPLGETYYKFLRKWFIKTDYAWALDIQKTKEFFEIIRRHSVHFTGPELLEFEKVRDCLPRYVMEFYEPTGEQKRLLKHLYDYWELPNGYMGDAESLGDDNELGSAEEYSHTMAILQKATQIASGFYYLRDGSIMYLNKSPKTKLLIEIIKQLLQEDRHRKILVWSRYIAERGPLQLALATANIPTVIGPDEDALMAFDSHRGTSPRVIIMPAGISQGFNELRIADVALWYSNIYSSELRDQAEKRLLRLGQKAKIVTFIDLASPDMADIEIITSLQTKDFTPARAATIINKYHPKPGLTT